MSERIDNIVYLQAWIDAEDGLWSWLFGYCNFSPQEEMLRLLTTEECEHLREVLTKTREFGAELRARSLLIMSMIGGDWL